MSIDLAHPPPHIPPDLALKIAQLAPKYLKRIPRPATFPLSLLKGDPTAETWMALETLFIQCLRTGDEASAQEILDRFMTRFGEKSDKVMGYQGMWEEATARNNEDIAKAIAIYSKILAVDGSNIPIHKRQIALLKSLGRTEEAINSLVKLLDISPTDAEAWAELADFYLAQDMYEQAIFCLEEVLIIQPNAWTIHAKVAEIIFTSSALTIQNPVDLARAIAESMRRYLRSIELCENYLRGYYGLKFTTSKLLPLITQATKTSAKDSTLYSDLSLPTQGTLEALNELATAKLAEIIRKSTSGEISWDGYDAGEIQAAKDLLDLENNNITR